MAPLLAHLLCLLRSRLDLPVLAPVGAPPPPLVPALFVIGGDSTADVSANNYLGTLARADREPCGRSFGTHRPAGRFSNGRVPVDYLAEKLGLPFVPPYLEQSMRMGVGSVSLSNTGGMIQGINYASAAAGILSSSGSELGMHVSLTQQVQQVEDTYEQLALALGEAAKSICSGGRCSLRRSGATTSSTTTCEMSRACRWIVSHSPMGVQSAPCQCSEAEIKGVHMSLTRQVKQVEDTYEQLALALGEATTVDLFKRSVFFLSIRSKDFIHYYLRRCVRRSDALSPMGVQSAPC
ncbi:hypothetical protein VPH35_009340 [Triticum aestivum]